MEPPAHCSSNGLACRMLATSGFLNARSGIDPPHSNRAARHFLVPSHRRLLDRESAISPRVRNIHEAFSHGCNGSALFVWIERRGSVAPSASPPRRWRSSPPLPPSRLCPPPCCLVRMVYPPPGPPRSP